ncbi:MAG: aminopeptidase P family protein [Armatimonadetes bacterium]|nr:aminopeptidase P family protein [Armatimonadota bacterium]
MRGLRPTEFPRVLSMRERAVAINRLLRGRLQTVLPLAMREAGIDMWLILCQEDDLDPVFTTMVPPDTWCPILQMLAFFDTGDAVERFNISGTNTHDLYERPISTQLPEQQWPKLVEIIEACDPQRIGINIGSVQWAGGGLTHNLYTQLVDRLPPPYVERLVSAEAAAARWLATLTEEDIALHEHVVAVAKAVIAQCYSPRALTPGITTSTDLEWHYWQRAADMGLEVAFKPYFSVVRSQAARERYGTEDRTIRPGDCVHCDVGLKYLRLNSDHQQWAYILRPGESKAPEGLRHLMAKANRLQDIFMAEFRTGLTGNELLANTLARARAEGVPNPKVYSHSLGYYLHEPGPLIGLPWEQERCVGRGDVVLQPNYAFTMELCVRAPVPEWDGQEVTLSIEEDVLFTQDGCRPIQGRQTEFHLV